MNPVRDVLFMNYERYLDTIIDNIILVGFKFHENARHFLSLTG